MLRATFDELLEAVEDLPVEAQEDFADLVRRRLPERGRQRVADDVREGLAEYAAGKVRPASVDEILARIQP